MRALAQVWDLCTTLCPICQVFNKIFSINSVFAYLTMSRVVNRLCTSGPAVLHVKCVDSSPSLSTELFGVTVVSLSNSD